MTSVSTSGFYDNAINYMTQLQKQTQQLQTQISTGNKLSSSSQDPVAASQMRVLQRQDALATAVSDVSDATKTNLSLTDSTLSQFTNVVTNLHTLAVQAANSTNSATDLAAIGTSMQAYYQNLLSLANTKDANGNALFGGNGNGTAYSIDASGNATYTGAATASTVSLGPGLSTTAGVTGPEFLNFQSGGSAQDLLSVVKNLADTLAGATTATAASAQSAASSALTTLTDGLTSISTAQTVVGTRLDWISTTSNIQTQLKTARQTSESTVGGTDLTTAAATLSQQMTVLEASQASFVKLSSLSLFNNLS